MNNRLPEGFQIRPPVRADLENMLAVTHAYELAHYGETDFTLEDMNTLWDSPTFDMTEQVRLVFDPAGRLICAAYFREQVHVWYSVSLDILPGYEDARLRAYLMALGEEWARQDMLKAAAEVRIFLRAWVPARNAEVNAWFRENPDFTEVRRFWEMQIELNAAPPVPVWPERIVLRPFDIERDTRAVYEADDQIFRDHWGFLPNDYPTWRHWTVERADFDPSLWFVACAGDQIAGISLCKNGEKAWVDTLGVTRPWRGKGLGLALLHHSFGEFYRRGRVRAGLGVDSRNLTGATRLYERAGMHVAHESVTYEKELRAGVDLSVQTLAV
jgi:mycothiol synthase